MTARIGKMKSKAEPAVHLLDSCRLLRTERDRERDLISQKEQEEDTISDLQVYFLRKMIGETDRSRLSVSISIIKQFC